MSASHVNISLHVNTIYIYMYIYMIGHMHIPDAITTINVLNISIASRNFHVCVCERFIH